MREKQLKTLHFLQTLTVARRRRTNDVLPGTSYKSA